MLLVKHHQYALKYQFIVDKYGRIVDVDGPHPAAKHDFSIYKGSKISNVLNAYDALVIG